jgi:hypothetical protein
MTRLVVIIYCGIRLLDRDTDSRRADAVASSSWDSLAVLGTDRGEDRIPKPFSERCTEGATWTIARKWLSLRQWSWVLWRFSQGGVP